MRKKIIAPRLVAVAHGALAMVNPTVEATKRMRVDISRDSIPVSGIITTSAIRYEVCTQLISSGLADSPPWIWVSELVTIWMSNSAMNMPKTMARTPTHWRSEAGWICRGGVGGGGAAEVTGRGARTRGGGDSRVICLGSFAWGLRSGLSRADDGPVGDRVARLAGVDRHRHGEPGPQQCGERTVGWQRDADRYALDDLGEIAGRVIWRQQRELGAATGRETVDPADDGL